jgi:dolichol-phosphate mannosyltransferase
LTASSLTHLVVIPTYNEIENIEKFLLEISKLNISVLVVDDNSPDGTGVLVKNLSKKSNKINLLQRSKKLGLGSAYRDGFKWGIENNFLYFVEMDADFSHRFEDLKSMLTVSIDNDVVIGSRYISGGGSLGWDTKRKFLSKFANLSSRILLKSKTHDMTSGFRCYSSTSLKKIKYYNTQSDGYSFQIEMTMRCEVLKLKISEIPIIFTERRLGNSKMSKKIIYEALFFIFKNGIKRWLNIKTF